MKKEEIEKAGTDFMNEECDDILFDPKECARRGFIAGAEFCQPEIDILVNSLSMVLNTNENSFIDGRKSRQPEIDELVKFIKSEKINLNNSKSRIRVDELLKKYEK